MCKKPFRRGVEEFGCGQCMPCRSNRRRLWTARIMLERAQHEQSCFVTLTYRNEDYPKLINREVMRDELQKWLKRLRYYASEFRYYVVAEFGSQTKRLHYHGLLFGISFPEHTNPAKDIRCSCRLCSSWPFGGAYVGDVAEKSAAYVLSYLTEGNKSELALMSRKPGIGAYVSEVISDYLCTKEGSKALQRIGDVPGVVRKERKLWPLGRYLRNRVRGEVGMEAGEREGSRDERLALLQVDLSTSVGREKHEGRRASDVARAEYRAQISSSKKGIGI